MFRAWSVIDPAQPSYRALGPVWWRWYTRASWIQKSLWLQEKRKEEESVPSSWYLRQPQKMHKLGWADLMRRASPELWSTTLALETILDSNSISSASS